MCTYEELEKLEPTMEDDEINFDIVYAAMGSTDD